MIGDAPLMTHFGVVLGHVGLNSADHREGFREYLRENWPIWLAFVRLADRIRARRPYYSADAIIHVLRFETDMSDTDTAYKINNNFRADFARLYNHFVGFEFFRTRDNGRNRGVDW